MKHQEGEGGSGAARSTVCSCMRLFGLVLGWPRVKVVVS